MGQPTKCTPAVTRKIVRALKGGCYRNAAAAAANIDDSTMRIWVQKGRQGIEPYASFFTAVKRAEREAEASILRIILESAKSKPETWTAAAWILERRHPERWGRKDRQDLRVTDVTGTESPAVRIARLRSVISALESAEEKPDE